jgi:hypothetical protein
MLKFEETEREEVKQIKNFLEIFNERLTSKLLI